jgi:N-acetylneuraminic acid mutarotase
MTRLVLALLMTSTAAAAEPEFAPLPKPVTSFGAAISDGYLYIYGGHSGKAHTYSSETTLGQFLRIKIDNPSKWEELPGGPAAQGTALVVHEGKLYRIGGMQPRNKPDEKSDSISLSSVACFDPKVGKWQELPELPEGRSSHDAVLIGDRIIVAGGWKMNGAGNGQDWHSTALVLDLKNAPMKWESIEQPFKRRALTMAAHAGKVYVIAGLNLDGKAELIVNVYDPDKKVWSKSVDIPEGAMNGFTPAACEIGGRLYLSPADGKLYRLAQDESKWDEVGALKLARVVHRLLPAKKQHLLAVGGSAKGAPTGSIETLEITK